MFERKIVLPFRNTSLVLDVNEAKDLQTQLNEELKKHEVSSPTLVPPTIVDGFLSREEIYSFFSQVYNDGHTLRQHAGKLHARLLNTVGYGTLQLDVRCHKCGTTDLRAPSCIEKNYGGHWSDPQRRLVDISVESLQALAVDVFKSKSTKTGPATLEDFRLLKLYL